MKNEKFVIIRKVVSWADGRNQVWYYEPVKSSGNVWASTFSADAKTLATKERAIAYAEKHDLEYVAILPLEEATKISRSSRRYLDMKQLVKYSIA
jgi:tripartite-type tricarboxylate transporter receptor subunit TctC